MDWYGSLGALVLFGLSPAIRVRKVAEERAKGSNLSYHRRSPRAALGNQLGCRETVVVELATYRKTIGRKFA